MAKRERTYTAAELMSEKEFSQQITDLAEGLGWMVFRTWDSRNSPAGEPDLRMIRPPRVIFAELKVKGNIPTRLQAEVLAELRLCPSVETYLWGPEDQDEIDRVLGLIPSPGSSRPGC